MTDGRPTCCRRYRPTQLPNGSEANNVIRRFNSLSRSQTQDVLNFLRSL